jgi:hypothetical protein
VRALPSVPEVGGRCGTFVQVPVGSRTATSATAPRRRCRPRSVAGCRRGDHRRRELADHGGECVQAPDRDLLSLDFRVPEPGALLAVAVDEA